jgi:hypothetical protein
MNTSRTFRTPLTSLLAFSAAALMAACGGSASPAETGIVAIGFPLGKADIQRAEYEVSGSNISPSLTGALTLNGDRAEGTVADVPAGTGRTVTVRAYTGTGANESLACSGSTTVDVTAGQTAPATLVLTCTDALGDISIGATFDASRTPDSATATVTGTGITGSIVVPLSVGGGTLTGVVRNVPAGANRSVTVSTTKNGSVECTGMSSVTVTPGQTASVTGLVLTCSNPPPTTGSVSISGQVNFTPRIHGITLSRPGVLPGGVVTAQVVASDGDGDSLTYAWSLNGAQSALFSAAAAATSDFTATNLSAGTYTLTVTVSDGISPSVSGSIPLVVGSNATIDWCNLQAASATSAVLGSPVKVYGQLYIANVTNPAGGAPGVLAQAGYGPAGTNPRSSPGAFTWVAAQFNATAQNVGNNDEYEASIAPLVGGGTSYALAYRYSTDGGASWIYADTNGPIGPGSTPSLLSLTVN